MRIASHEDRDVTIVLGQGEVDLCRYVPKEGITKLHINVILGVGVIRYDPNVPVVIESTAAFADCCLPDGVNVAFGKQTFRSPSYRSSRPSILLTLTTVLGTTRFANYASINTLPTRQKSAVPSV